MRRMRWVILGLCLLMCMTTEAFAEQQSGLNVRITSNQKHYGQAEIAEVVVAVENPLDQAVYNVEIGSRLPEGFKSAADSYVLNIEEIPAQSTVTRTFYIMKSGVILTVQSDRDRYDRDEIAELTMTVVNHSDSTIYQVDLASYLPDGLQYVRMEDIKTLRIPQIDVDESVTRMIRVKVMEPLPQTGDNTPKALLAYTLLLAVSAALLIWCRRNKEIRQ